MLTNATSKGLIRQGMLITPLLGRPHAVQGSSRIKHWVLGGRRSRIILEKERASPACGDEARTPEERRTLVQENSLGAPLAAAVAHVQVEVHGPTFRVREVVLTSAVIAGQRDGQRRANLAA